MTAPPRAASRFAWKLAIVAVFPVVAFPATVLAQAGRDSTPMPGARSGDTTAISLSPARPKQGGILQIRVRLAAHQFIVADTMRPVPARADTLAGGSAWTIPRPDSVKPDSLTRPRPDSVPLPRSDSLPAIRVDSVRSDSAAGPRHGRVAMIRGTLFGEPLHFIPGDSGTYVAIGGIPVDAATSVRVPLVIDRAGLPSDTVEVRLEIGRTAYKMEKLTVAPKFGHPPDSALAARMAREQKLAADVSRRSHDVPVLWTSAFERPRPSRVTSAFGDGREFNGKVQSRHMGLDLAGAVGTPVLAAGRGIVALVGEFYLAGNAVYLDHGGGLVTAYFHLSAVDVAMGDTVNAGETIGKVGATGRVTGPHLHWVARYGSVTIDPATLLDLAPARREP